MDIKALRNKLDYIAEETPQFGLSGSANELSKEMVAGLDDLVYIIQSLQEKMDKSGKKFNNFEKMYQLLDQLDNYTQELFSINDEGRMERNNKMRSIANNILGAQPPGEFQVIDGSINLTKSDISKLQNYWATGGDIESLASVSGIQKILKGQL